MKSESNKTVAVIIPYYNGGEYIERALKSIESQIERPDEIIIVDDGSAEYHKKIIENLKVKYKFELYTKENGGQGSARNYGVQMAKSNYICLLDQDDFFLKNHIAELKINIPEDESLFGCVYGDLYEADGAGNIVSLNMANEYSSQPKRNIKEMIARDMFILPSAALINKQAFIQIGGFDCQFTGYEDDDFFLRLFRAGYSMIWLDKAVTVWCIHSSSTSYSLKMSRSRLKYIKKLLNMFPDDEQRRIFYLRDLIIPRFLPLIFSDLVSYKINRIKDSLENKLIAKEFINIILKNKSVSSKNKLKISFKYFLIKSVPVCILKKIVRNK